MNRGDVTSHTVGYFVGSYCWQNLWVSHERGQCHYLYIEPKFIPWIQDTDQAYSSDHVHRHLGGDDPGGQFEAMLYATMA